MKLTLTLAELESGERIRRVSDKQMEKIRDMYISRTPVPIKPPLHVGGNLVTLVYLTGIAKLADKRTKITLKAVPNRAFQVINARTKELVSLTVDFPYGQYTFDKQGERKTQFTTKGGGVDPATDPDPNGLLAKLIDQDQHNEIVRRCCNHVSLQP